MELPCEDLIDALFLTRDRVGVLACAPLPYTNALAQKENLDQWRF